eukprot:m.282780 g.282780  ORF g.282780 m.282780 type:complete len:780 (+) comp19866_c0_seq3:142-2481(+)
MSEMNPPPDDGERSDDAVAHLSEFVRQAVAHKREDSTAYYSVKQHVVDAVNGTDNESLFKWLSALCHCVSALEPRSSTDLVHAMLGIDWTAASPPVLDLLEEYIRLLISAHSTYAEECMTQVVRNFLHVDTPPPQAAAEEGGPAAAAAAQAQAEAAEVRSQMIRERACRALKEALVAAPLQSPQLLRVLERALPHVRCDTAVHLSYLRGLATFALQDPDVLLPLVVPLLMQSIVKIDLHTVPDEGSEDDNDDDDVDDSESDSESLSSSAGSAATSLGKSSGSMPPSGRMPPPSSSSRQHAVRGGMQAGTRRGNGASATYDSDDDVVLDDLLMGEDASPPSALQVGGRASARTRKGKEPQSPPVGTAPAESGDESAESGDESAESGDEDGAGHKLDATMRLALDLVHTVWHTHATTLRPGAAVGPGPDTAPTHASPTDAEAVELHRRRQQLFDVFWHSFSSVVLTTYQTRHVQFIMFYLCSLHPSFREQFVEGLLQKALDRRCALLTRQTSVSYIGSLLARGVFVEADTLVKPTLTVMSRNIQDYAHDHHRPNRNDPECLLFYALCQALFYTLCFRLPELLEMDRGAMFISSLRLDTIVGCSLCPLQVCQKDVAMQFSRITRQHDVVYCNQYLRRSRSVLSRRIDTFQMQYTDGDAPAHQVEDFFPFDPYELKTSGEYIRPQYRTWTVCAAETMGESSDSDDNGEHDDGMHGELSSSMESVSSIGSTGEHAFAVPVSSPRDIACAPMKKRMRDAAGVAAAGFLGSASPFSYEHAEKFRHR